MKKLHSSTLFTFGYPNLMLSLLQYISFYFNINIAIFVVFQIAVYMHTLCCVLLHIHKPKKPELTPSGRLVPFPPVCEPHSEENRFEFQQQLEKT